MKGWPRRGTKIIKTLWPLDPSAMLRVKLRIMNYELRIGFFAALRMTGGGFLAELGMTG